MSFLTCRLLFQVLLATVLVTFVTMFTTKIITNDTCNNKGCQKNHFSSSDME